MKNSLGSEYHGVTGSHIYDDANGIAKAASDKSNSVEFQVALLVYHVMCPLADEVLIVDFD